MRCYNETEYFKTHVEMDKKHECMGLELLEGLTPKKYERLLEIQTQGWTMINTVCNQIAKLTLECTQR